MLKVLCIVGHYLPGFRAGGPVRTLSNLVEWLGDELCFLILTADHDLGDSKPYAGVKSGQWQNVGKAKVLYLSHRDRGWSNWRRLLQQIDYDILYLNGFFSTLTIQTLALRRLGLVPTKPAILAPRGEFALSALSLKQTKKRFYLEVVLRGGLYRNLVWQATGSHEQQAILETWHRYASESCDPEIYVAPNLPSAISDGSIGAKRQTKTTGMIRMIMLARVARIKNLDYALRLLQQATGDIEFDIYGPIEDNEYWQECLILMNSLPDNVSVSYKGSIMAADVQDILACYHLLFFPTQSENFGHVILEALAAGSPVLISDQTPWRDIALKKAGWDLPLEQPQAFQRILQNIIDMDTTNWRQWSEGALKLASDFKNDPAIVEANRQLFLSALVSTKRQN